MDPKEAERLYDLERNGQLYTKPDPDPAPNLPADIKAWIDRRLAEERATVKPTMPASPSTLLLALADWIEQRSGNDEQAIAEWIDTRAPDAEDTDTIISVLQQVVGEDDGIDPRFDRVIDAVDELPDHQRDQAIALWEGFLAGIAAAA